MEGTSKAKGHSPSAEHPSKHCGNSFRILLHESKIDKHGIVKVAVMIKFRDPSTTPQVTHTACLRVAFCLCRKRGFNGHKGTPTFSKLLHTQH